MGAVNKTLAASSRFAVPLSDPLNKIKTVLTSSILSHFHILPQLPEAFLGPSVLTYFPCLSLLITASAPIYKELLRGETITWVVSSRWKQEEGVGQGRNERKWVRETISIPQAGCFRLSWGDQGHITCAA